MWRVPTRVRDECGSSKRFLLEDGERFSPENPNDGVYVGNFFQFQLKTWLGKVVLARSPSAGGKGLWGAGGGGGAVLRGYSGSPVSPSSPNRLRAPPSQTQLLVLWPKWRDGQSFATCQHFEARETTLPRVCHTEFRNITFVWMNFWVVTWHATCDKLCQPLWSGYIHKVGKDMRTDMRRGEWWLLAWGGSLGFWQFSVRQWCFWTKWESCSSREEVGSVGKVGATHSCQVPGPSMQIFWFRPFCRLCSFDLVEIFGILDHDCIYCRNPYTYMYKKNSAEAKGCGLGDFDFCGQLCGFLHCYR